jgi:serine/threonine protein phosphatase PrpC
VSRAFGDTLFKSLDNDKMKSPVISTPDITSEVVTPMTEFAVMASDGLWDTIEPQAVVNFVKRKIQKKEDLDTISKALVNEAISRGSVDNVSVVILLFHVLKK